MDFAFKLLVIIVSSALTLFLIVGIIAVIRLIGVLSSLKRITQKAEKIADSAEAVGDFFRKSAGPVALGKFITNIAESISHHKSHKGDS